jgi:hypothetical protein
MLDHAVDAYPAGAGVVQHLLEVSPLGGISVGCYIR